MGFGVGQALVALEWGTDAPSQSFSDTGMSPKATRNVTGAQFQRKTKADDFSAPNEPVCTGCVPEYTEKLEEAWKLKTRKHKAPKDKIINKCNLYFAKSYF